MVDNIFKNDAWVMNPPAEEQEENKESARDSKDPYEDENFDQEEQETLPPADSATAKEQAKLIQIQKAKIEALKTELEDSIKKMNLQEIKIEDLEAKQLRQGEDAKV
mmetsp:Transcript_4186/g.7102  ORF Transcript_4186/g.7102 Transcript_4186/m.7102 type:complete len:107 (-) Transcript_4186:487-807(-)